MKEATNYAKMHMEATETGYRYKWHFSHMTYVPKGFAAIRQSVDVPVSNYLKGVDMWYMYGVYPRTVCCWL